jgi:N-acetylglucosamine-6-phosphate deacetylase
MHKVTKQKAIAADRVFDGEKIHSDLAVVFEGSQILALVPRSAVSALVETRALPDGVWLAPGFIDVQVNGGGDFLFNDAPTPEALSALARAHRKFGTTGFLPTLISDIPEKTDAALNAVDTAMDKEPSILGLHLEGPFLSPDKAGVHKREFIRVPTNADLAVLTATRRGALMTTLAPERVPSGFIAALTAAGVRVSLGHSMATYEETRAAMTEGLIGFTHLFNAMRQLSSRDPGPIAAALEGPKAWYGLIADGIHVHPATLRVALAGGGKPMLVTDAMPPVGGVRSAFTLYGEEIAIQEHRCIRTDGTLAGTLLDMASAVRNCVHLLDKTLEHGLRFASRNPAEFLGLGHMLGRLAPGYRADMIALEPQTVTVLETWVAGRNCSETSSSQI